MTRAATDRGRPSPRLHRPTDGALGITLLLAVVALVGGLRLYGRGAYLDRRLSTWTHALPRWLTLSWASIAGLGFVVFTAAGLYSLARQDRRHLLNGLVAALAGAAASGAFIASPVSAVLQARPGAFVTLALVVSFVTASEVGRRGRWRRWSDSWTLALLVTGLTDGALGVLSLAAVTGGGLAVGFLARWVLGASSTRPGEGEIRAWLRNRGVDVAELHPSDTPRVRTLSGTLGDGTAVSVRLADRDARLSGLPRRMWALLRLRSPVAAHLPPLSRSRLRDLALAAILAERSGVPAPRLLLLEPIDDQTLVLATSRPGGSALRSAPTRAQAVSAFSGLRRIHDSGLAHGYVRLEQLVDCGDATGFLSLARSAPAASELSRRLDVAQLLVTVALSAGPDTAIEALREGYGPVDETAVAAVLQPVALAPWGWSAMRRSSRCLGVLRSRLLAPGTPVPALQLERFRWRTVIMVAVLVVVAYVLVGQISSVNLPGALSRMNLAWFGVAVAASAVTYWAAGASLEAFAPRPPRLTRAFLVQVSTAFAGVAMPSTVGYVALNARYLARQQIDSASVATTIALSQVANVATTILTVVVLALLTGSGMAHTRFVPGTDVLVGGAVVVVLVAAVAVVPQTRLRLVRLVAPHLRALLPRILEAVSQPGRLAASIGASMLLNSAYVAALMAALASLGASPPLLPTAIVYLLGSFVGSAAPTPGGLGGVEAALAAGLTGIGIPAHQAIPAVVVFRLATFWLPIPAGWATYAALRRTGTL